MKHKILRFGKGFRVVLGNRRSQAAQMVLTPGKSEGSAKNRHYAADQWLFVVEGKGTAIINGHRHSLRSGSLLLIEHGDRHVSGPYIGLCCEQRGIRTRVPPRPA